MNKEFYPIIIALIAGVSAIAGSLGGVMLQNRNTENSEQEKRKTLVVNKVISDEKVGFLEQLEILSKSGLLNDPDNKILSAIKEKSTQIDCGLSVKLPKFNYMFGEKVDLQVSTKRPCYLLIISMDAKGKISKLYPNSYEESKKKVHHVDFLNQSFPVVASPPEGANIIFFMASVQKNILTSSEPIPMSRGMIRTNATSPAEGAVDLFKITQDNKGLNILVRAIHTIRCC